MSYSVEQLEPRKLLATFSVTSLADAGVGTLRQAVLDANALAGADVIEFQANVAGAINLTSELVITEGLTITGPGAARMAIDGGDSTRLFNFLFGESSLSGLTLRNGAAPDDGGAILIENLATVSVTTTTFTANEAPAGSGGAIANFGTLNLLNSTITRGVTLLDGGGIYNAGVADLNGANISGNDAGRNGGGIRNDGGFLTFTRATLFENTAGNHGGALSSNGGTLAITDSTLSGNTAGVGGGGLMLESTPTTITRSTIDTNTATFGSGVHADSSLTLTSVTISGNSASSDGGGIWSGGALVINNSTIANNTAGSGAGILVGGGSVTILSSIIAANTGGDLAGSVLPTASSTNNLISSETSAGGLVDGENGNIVGVDARLAPLSDNGGTTSTHALLPGSPALGMGINPLGLATDQRGEPRLRGSRVDIGAFEALVPPTPRGAATGSGTHHVAWVDDAGNVLVYQQGWTYEVLQEKTSAPAAIGDAIVWVDPKDSLVYVAAPSADGLLLFTRSSAGTWSFRNLITETGATDTPTRDLTHFISIRQKIVVIAGITDDGRVVAFRQSLLTTDTGEYEYLFVNIADDLVTQGFGTPTLTGLTSYVPSWDTWHLAGVDTEGNIQSIWINTNNPAFTKWRLNNLSTITGAPPIASQLAVTLTSWGGINLTGLDESGNLLTTWWVPRFEGQWAVNNLTTAHGGEPLVGGNLSGYTTPWGGINYVGVDAEGDVRVFWWVPSFEGQWAFNRLLPTSTPPEQIPTGALSSAASASGILNVFGLNTEGHVLRMSWQPGGSGIWSIEDLTEIADKV
jgi:hypothetical protein